MVCAIFEVFVLRNLDSPRVTGKYTKITQLICPTEYQFWSTALAIFLQSYLK